MESLLRRPGCSVPEEIMERYSYGECMWLACAIHRHLGWPMRAVIGVYGSTEWIAHAWVVFSPAGRPPKEL